MVSVIKIKDKRREISVPVKKVPIMSTGLMFLRRKKARSLLFEFKKNTQSKFSALFVFFPFLIIFLDKDKKIIECKKVKPFQINVSCKKFYRRAIEIPFNKNHEEVLRVLVENR